MFDYESPFDHGADPAVPHDAGDPGSDVGRQAIPPGLDDMEPGPVLSAFLSTCDVSKVSGHDRLIVLRAHQRMLSHHQAMIYRSMCAVWQATEDEIGGDPVEVGESAAAEVRIALGLTRRAADRQMSLARDLDTRIPEVAHALHRGDIDGRRAEVFDRETSGLPAHTARKVVDRVIEEAASLTTGELRARLQRLRMEVDPEDAARRCERAQTDRRVVVEPSPDGTAHLHAYDLPADRATAIMRRLTSTARSLNRREDERTTDQLRADILVDTLLGTSTSHGPSSRSADVTLHIDLETLAELADRPGDLAGYGPVVSDVARRVASESTSGRWAYIVSDALGRPVSVGTTRRRPSVTQRRTVLGHIDRCIFPGCRIPARDCDLDHTAPWSTGGPTEVSNLAPLCRHDHRIKAMSGWSYRRSGDHHVEWRTPLGQTRSVVTSHPP